MLRREATLTAKVEWDLRGVIVPLITPFKDDLSVDYSRPGRPGGLLHRRGGVRRPRAVRHHRRVRHAVAPGARRRDRGGRQADAQAGAGDRVRGLELHQEAVELTRLAAELGADATLQVGPYYNKPTQDGLFNHFAAIAAASELPLIIYNIPGRTSRNIEPKTIIRLWEEIPSVVGLKDCSCDLHQTMEIYRGTDPETFKIYSGEDIMTLSLLCHGAAGAIAAVAHVVGPEVKAMCEAVWAGRLGGGPRYPLPHHGRRRRPVRRAEPHPGQAGRGVARAAGGPAAPSARTDDPGRAGGAAGGHAAGGGSARSRGGYVGLPSTKVASGHVSSRRATVRDGGLSASTGFKVGRARPIYPRSGQREGKGRILQYYLAIWSLLLGLVIGSFLNVVIYRLPRRESLVRPGSHCPRCGTAIRWYDNIPVVSWVLLRGRCRVVPFADIAFATRLWRASPALAFLAAFWRFGRLAGGPGRLGVHRGRGDAGLHRPRPHGHPQPDRVPGRGLRAGGVHRARPAALVVLRRRLRGRGALGPAALVGAAWRRHASARSRWRCCWAPCSARTRSWRALPIALHRCGRFAGIDSSLWPKRPIKSTDGVASYASMDRQGCEGTRGSCTYDMMPNVDAEVMTWL